MHDQIKSDWEVSMDFKKPIAAIIAAIMLIGILPFSSFAADWGEGDTLEDALSELKAGFDDAQLDWLQLPGLGVIKQRYTYFMFKNERTGTIDEHPVYCIDPAKLGAYDIVAAVGPNTDGSSTATYIRGEKVGDPKYRGILNAGYPHQMLSSLGLQTREEGYYATKIALWMYIRGSDPTKLAINPAYANDDPAALRVRAAAIDIFNNGIGGSGYEPELTLKGKPNNTARLDANGEYYVQEIEVYASGWIGENPAACGDVRLAWASAPPAGTVVFGTNGENISSSLNVVMNTVSGKDGRHGKITIKYPADGLDPETFSPPTLNASALLPNSEIYVAYAKVNKDKYQRYLVERDPKIELTASFVSQVTYDDIDDPQELRIRKLQAGTNIPLEGAVFEIRDPDGKLVYSLTTDENGIIDVPLSVMGNYTVTETAPPRHHLLPEVRTQSVTVRYGETAEVTFTDAPYGLLRAVKRDAANGRPLGGAAIRIKNIVTNTAQEGFTDSSGSVVFGQLPVGAYEIVEIAAPDGYALDSTVHTVNVVPLSEGETSYALTNKAKAGLRIVKFDRQAMTPIEGVAFEIWRDGELYGIYRTDAWGEIELRNLPAGTYTAREVATVSPYVLDSTAQWIEIHDGQGYISELYFFNLQKPGIRLVKVDSETLAPLPNARFRISRVGGSESNEYTTDIHGEIDLSALEPGAYTVKELAAPDGYLVDFGIRVIQLNAGENAQFVFTNTRKPSFELVKLDSKTGLRLAGATFRIARIEDGSHYLDRVTDTQGTIRIDNLLPGVYSAQELAAPEGYVRDETEYHVELFPGKTSTLVVSNAHKPDLRIVKRDELTGEPLANAAFTVRKADGSTYSTVTTDAGGEAWLYGMDPGVYEITETLPPPTYFPSTAPQLITLFPNRTGTVEFANRPRPVLTVLKRDAVTGRPLAGVKFLVQRLEGETIGEFLTDESGRIKLSPKTGYLLEEAIYRVTEVLPPNEYLPDANPAKDVLLKWYEPTELIFENLLKPTLIFIKTNALSGRGIDGATYRVEFESPEGSVTNLGSYKTKCGLIVLPHVLPGWYSLTETSPAPGYSLPTNPAQRLHLAPGENSYTHEQTDEDLYIDARTDPGSGSKGACEDCGYLCSVLCAGNCGNPGGGNMSSAGGGAFGNMTITNGKGEPIGGGSGGGTSQTDATPPVLTAGTTVRTGNLTAAITFTSSEAGKYYFACVAEGEGAPTVATGGLGSNCAAGANTITVYLTSGAKDVYIKVKDAAGNVSAALKVPVPAYEPQSSGSAGAGEPAQSAAPEEAPPIEPGKVIYINPAFPGIIIKFGNE
jgi:hypothetical protein